MAPTIAKKIAKFKVMLAEKERDIQRLEAEANELNTKARLMRQELPPLYRSYVGEIVKSLEKKKKLVKVQRDGKHVLDVHPRIFVNCIKSNSSEELCRLQNILRIHLFFCKLVATDSEK